MSYLVNALVEQIGQAHFEGNIIPMPWYQHIRFDNGRPDTNAILLLSDIVYWYRPSIVRDESSGRIVAYKKKFKADLLQRNYQNYEDLFGFSKKQIRESFIRLESLDLIKRVFRTIETPLGPQTNVMFIEINPVKVLEITHTLPPLSVEGTPSFPVGKDPLPLKEIPLNFKVKTYTEITPENTTEINTHQARATESNLSKSFRETDDLKIQSSLSSEQASKLSINKSLPCESKSFLTPQHFPKHAFPQRADLQAMVAMWNELVRKSEAPVELTPERMPILAKRLVESFGSRLSAWKHYCMQITKSSFLMGQGERGWKVTLDWALEPANISKVLEGNYQSASDPTVQEALPLVPVLDLSTAHPLWSGVCQLIIEHIGLAKFNSWIGGLIPEGLDTPTPLLKAPTSFIKTWVERNYLELIREAFKQVDPRIEEISIIHTPGETA